MSVSFYYINRAIGLLISIGCFIKKKPGSCLLSRLISSIIGARELDFRVRNGNGYFLPAMATGQ